MGEQAPARLPSLVASPGDILSVYDKGPPRPMSGPVLF